MLFIFPHFIIAEIPHVKCDVGSRWENCWWHQRFNTDKCHLLVSSSDAVSLRVSEYDVKNSECEKLVSVKFGNMLTFEKHTTDISRKA